MPNIFSRRAAKGLGRPVLDIRVLDAYRPAAGKSTRSNTASTIIRTWPVAKCAKLFDALRKAVLELDACVTEEFLKLYAGLQGRDQLCRRRAAGPPTAFVARICRSMRSTIRAGSVWTSPTSAVGATAMSKIGLSSLDDLPPSWV